MTNWTQTRAGSSELQAGKMRLTTTNQSDRGCGWCWHIHADEYSEQIACAGQFATEEDAKAAAIAWARTYCMTALMELPK